MSRSYFTNFSGAQEREDDNLVEELVEILSAPQVLGDKEAGRRAARRAVELAFIAAKANAERVEGLQK